MPPRRKRLKGDGLIRGLRLESELATAVIDTAYAIAEATGEPVNLAGAARHLIRLGTSQWTGVQSMEKEGFFRGIALAKRQFAEAVK